MKYFIGKIPTTKGDRWYLFKGNTELAVLRIQEFRRHPVIEGTLKELSREKYFSFKKTLGLKTIIV